MSKGTPIFLLSIFIFIFIIGLSLMLSCSTGRSASIKEIDEIIENAPDVSTAVEWLKQVQDTSFPEKALIPNMEDNVAQTFNNSLCAMAFLLVGEKGRAERIPAENEIP